MLIRDIFATTIEERIEPVVKVADRKPVTILNEITNLVITPQWEKHLCAMLDVYTENFDRVDEHEIAIWISGFFGSGKSLLMKTFGLLLQGGELATPEHPAIHQLFMRRLPADSPERGNIERALALCQRRISTSLIGGNLHAQLANANDPLAQIVFKLFAAERGYSNNWAFAWTIEYQLDLRGLTEEFRQRVCERCGMSWQEVMNDSDFYSEDLNVVAAELLPQNFSSPAAILDAVTQAHSNGITPEMLLKRLHSWCSKQDQGSRRHKVLLQLDELGQWISSGNSSNSRLMEVQALVETAMIVGEGRIWIVVTAHGDVQALKESVQQDLYAKINQRFDTQCKLSNEDIYEVVQKRLLSKTQTASALLRQRFEERRGELTDMGSLRDTRRVYPIPTAENFANFYPYLPWTVSVIPNVIKNVAQATGRDEALTGSNRTMMGVVQLGILDTSQLLDKQVGRLICLADLYPQLSSDAPIETRTDMSRILENVHEADAFTVQVAYALYLLGQDEYILCTLQNVTLALVDSIDVNLGTLRPRVKTELERLVHHGYAKQVGEIYIFLSTQQRGFQDKVRRREQELHNQNYELSQKLKEGYEGYDALRFEEVSLGISGLKKSVKVELDGKVINRTQGNVTVRVYSPLQYVLEPDIANDTILKQRSNQEVDTLFLRMGNVKDLRRALARAVATAEVADHTLATSTVNDPEREVARQSRQHDLTAYRQEVHKALDDAMSSSKIFMRGNSYDLMHGDNANEKVRNTLSMLLVTIYSRLADLPYRILNEENTIRAALNDNTANPDLSALHVYNADGTLNMSNPLISALKGRLPVEGDDQGAKNAEDLRADFEKPPFGWDGNVVKIGLALLLRASQCRLIENSTILSDPQSPDVFLALTKAQRFRSLRVQAVRSNLQAKDILAIRGLFELVFGYKPAVVEQTLHKTLGDELTKLHEQARTLREWFTASNCPLPAAFESGDSIVTDLRNSAVSTIRLPQFQNEHAAIVEYVKLLQELTRFKSEHGKTYSQLRDFFNSMTNAEIAPAPVTSFLEDWRVVTRNREITTAPRWQSLLQAYQKAQQSLTEQITQWQQEVVQGVAALEAMLPEQLQQAGVPTERLSPELTRLSPELQRLRSRTENATLNFSEARRLRSDFLSVRMNLSARVHEAAKRYEPQPQPNPPAVESQPSTQRAGSSQPVGGLIPEAVYINWHQVLGQVRISSPDDLDAVFMRLKLLVNSELARNRVVIIE